MVNSRDKGKRGEREAAELINLLFPQAGAKRGFQFKGGQDSPDITHSIGGIHFEVKRTEVFKPTEWSKQCLADCGTNVPVILYRPSRGEWWFCIRWDWLHRVVHYFGLAGGHFDDD